ncbi:MAG TPA: DegT/DnrJ/EryC1/StrS family aminotransferase [candidate division Zixibacteria bacterium]|nr:DegT/DnrJ/EryC1/StrS family aminotransferase [candidate division Zixibacteria bacterium]
MSVPLLDLKRQYEMIRDEVEREVLAVLRSGYYILGPNVKAFEAEAADFTGAKFAVGVNSGTDALRIALRAFGVGEGDEVITTAFSYFATCEIIDDVGATPVFADIEPKTFNIDAEDIRRKITPKTKAIIPVHIFGQMCDMGAVMAIAEEHGLAVIEDACQAIGAACPSGKAGSVGHAGAFSFFPSKNLGAVGDGGLITTNSQEVRDFAVSMRMHGTRNDRYRHETFGYNTRLDEIQAAVLKVKLRHLDDFNDKRRANAERYRLAFAGAGGIEPAHELEGYRHTYHQYTVRIEDGKRDDTLKHLQEKAIGCAVYYMVPLHRQPAYSGRYDELSLPETERACNEVLSLPIFPELTCDEQSAVIEAVQEGLTG